MIKNPIRRAQLIAPFGVGAMMVVKDGTSLISAGIDHWYEYEEGKQGQIVDEEDFKVEEWRLQDLLEVDHFRLPPDYRETNEHTANKHLRIPFLRFPQWHFCPGCKRLYKFPLTAREKPKCPECQEKQKIKFLAQVPFVAMCKRGHIQDFPWSEWVHELITPTCHSQMKIIATGGASLAAQQVTCECGAKRSLGSITEEGKLTKNLEAGAFYVCQGKQPWLGTEKGSLDCGENLRGSLRSASNLYYADVRSAIYLPRGDRETPSQLIEILEKPPLSSSLNVIAGLTDTIEPSSLRKLSVTNKTLLQPYTDPQIKRAIDIVIPKTTNETDHPYKLKEDEDPEIAFRRAEFDVLRKPRNEEALVIKEPDINSYDPAIKSYFERVTLISKLRETRALAGFNRIVPENDLTLEEKKALLRKNPPLTKEDNWIPAYVVYGEGIFLELNEHLLQQWEARIDVCKRANPLVQYYQILVKNNKVRQKAVSPRFILLHTFAHLLINRLTFECGYGASALRERLYISNRQESPMAGILVYTAAGDSEGTMGGLVRMGQARKLEPVLQHALQDAQWCSADPVCMETGNDDGQGATMYNLAACHNCALIPETACEEFNHFLDRALVIGKVNNRELGYFTQENTQLKIL